VDLGDAIVSWKPAPTGRHGAQKKFSDHAIETALTLRTVFKLPLRRAEGFLRSVLSLMSVDRSGLIVAEALTHGIADDARTALDLIDQIEGDIVSITADAAYDTIAIYDAAAARGARVVVPPIKTATRSRRRSPLPCARARTTMRMKESGAAGGRRNRDTTSRPAWRTPSSDTNRSLVTDCVLDIRSHRKLKHRSPATS
jgi:hypothetical protein